jgi:MFS family permease
MTEKKDEPNPPGRPTLDPGVAMDALKNRAFRWFIAGRLFGSPTGPMRAVVRGWLVYELTGSALMLGWVSAAGAAATIILAPLGGLVADRFDKRFVMLFARIALILDSAIMATLIFTGLLRPWHIAAVAVLESSALAFMGPAQRTVVSELVDRRSLFSALSVAAVFEGLMGIVGAYASGFITETLGPGGVYVIMSLFFVFVGYTLNKLPPSNTDNAPRGSVHADLWDGLRYVKASPVILLVLAIMFSRFLFTQPYREFRPAYVDNTLGLGASGLGLLTSASSAGALVAALVGASLGNTRFKGYLLLGAGVIVGISLILFVQMPVLPLPFIIVAFESGFSRLSDVLSNSLIQLKCRVEYRARVDSLRSLLLSTSRLIVVPIGALVDVIGLIPVITVLGTLVIITHLSAGLLHPPLRHLR